MACVSAVSTRDTKRLILGTQTEAQDRMAVLPICSSLEWQRLLQKSCGMPAQRRRLVTRVGSPQIPPSRPARNSVMDETDGEVHHAKSGRGKG